MRRRPKQYTGGFRFYSVGTVEYSTAVVKLSIDKLSGNGPGVFKSPEVGLKIANLSIVGVALFTFSRSESSTTSMYFFSKKHSDAR